jgi:hypothetical protein
MIENNNKFFSGGFNVEGPLRGVMRYFYPG